MPHSDPDATAVGDGRTGFCEPCCKKLKSAEGPCAPCHHARPDLQGVQEAAGSDRALEAVPGSPASGHPHGDRGATVSEPDPEPNGPPCTALTCGGPQMSTSDGIYSTSKAFIGPLYKPPGKKRAGERRKDPDPSVTGPGGQDAKKPLSAAPRSGIDSELCQFYKEIEELEQETDDLDSGCRTADAPRRELGPADEGPLHSPLRGAEEKQGELRTALRTHGAGQPFSGPQPGGCPSKGQLVPPQLCQVPLGPFPPLGQSLPPFFVPHGPPPPLLPSFNYPFNTQRFHPPPHVFLAHRGSPRQGNGGSPGPSSWGGLASERPGEHPACRSGTPPCGGALGLQEGPGRNSLSGAMDGCWVDLPVDSWPRGDLLVDKCPGADMRVDRWPGADAPVDKCPGADMRVDRWPGADMPVDKCAGADMHVDRWPRADVPVDKCPGADTRVDTWPGGVELPVDRWPGGDLRVDRWFGADLPVDRWPGAELPLPLPLPRQAQEEKLEKWQKLLILLRGLPGSGKTTLSRILLGRSPDGIVFSTDDYFHHCDGYRYDAQQLSSAHDWNQNRAKEAILQGRSPIIIDNTNTQAWEMRPYVEMALGQGYRVEFHEPETWWKFDPEELEKRNQHGVPRRKIAQMLERYEFHVSPALVMNAAAAEPPPRAPARPPPECRPRWGGPLGSCSQSPGVTVSPRVAVSPGVTERALPTWHTAARP